MFFIYGSAVLFEPLCHAVSGQHFLLRGTVYVLLIFAIEYVAGMVMKWLNVCPWDYSDAKLNVHGVIRLDYAPAWFALGLFFEMLVFRLPI
jgi:uncharacterized membrane protein